MLPTSLSRNTLIWNFPLTSDNNQKQGDEIALISSRERINAEKINASRKDGRYKDKQGYNKYV